MHRHRKLKTLQEYFWTLPKPLVSDDDIAMSLYSSLTITWETWSKDPIKAAALRAIFSCLHRLEIQPLAPALAQNVRVRFLHSYLLQVVE
jgi:hypothetical protein